MKTIAGLAADLRTQMNGTTTLDLSGTTLGSTSVQQFVTGPFSGGKLTVRECIVTEGATSVALKGRCDVYGQPDIGVTAELVPSENTVEATVTLELAANSNWSLIAPEIADSFLARLEYSTLLLKFCSRDGGATGADATLRAGRNLNASVKLPAFMQTVGWLLGDPGELDLVGPMPVGSTIAALDLRSQTRAGVQVGFLELDIAARVLAITSTPDQAGASPKIVPTLFLVSTVELETAEKPKLAMALHVPDQNAGPLSFDVDTSGLRMSDLGALSRLLKTDLSVSIPLADSLELARLGFMVSLEEKRLAAASAVIQSAKPITLFEGFPPIPVLELTFLVLDPMTQPQLSISLRAQIKLGDLVLEGYLQLPDLSVWAGLAPDCKPKLSALARQYQLPDVGLPDFDLVELDASVDPRTQCVGFDCALAGEWPLWNKATLQSLGFGLIVGPGEKSAYVRGQLGLGAQTRLLVEADVCGSGITFKGTLENVSLASLIEDIATTFDMPRVGLPDIPHDLVFKEVSVEIAPAAGTFAFSASATGRWDLLDDGGGFQIESASFNLARVKAGDQVSYPFAIEIQGGEATGGAALVPGLNAHSLHINFTHDGKKWTAHGELVADLFEAKGISLIATYQRSEESSTLVLAKTHPKAGKEYDLNVLGFTSNAALAVGDVTVVVARISAQGATAAVTTFALDAGAQLTVGSTVDLEGRLKCGRLGLLQQLPEAARDDALRNDAGTGIVFELLAQKPIGITAPAILLDDPAHSPRLNIQKASIGFIRADDGSWTLDGGATVSLEQFPQRLQSVLPRDAVTGTIKVDRQQVSVSLDKVIGDVAVPLPALPVSGAQLGDLKVNALNPKLTVGFNGDVTFSFEPTIRLPDNTNRVLFGATANGSEKHHVFVTNAAIGARLSFGIAGGQAAASFDLTQSPFAAFQVATYKDANGKDISYWPCHLGPAGTINIDVPVFKAGATGSFTVQGGFKQDPNDPLCLPLAPFKALLGDHLGGIGKALPDRIPLLHDRPPLFVNGKVQSAALIEAIETIGKHADPQFELSAPLEKAITDIGTALSGLPDRFIQYLEAGPPGELHFSAATDVSGSLTVELTTGADRDHNGAADPRPLRVLLPSIPNLMGFTIYNLSFGPVFGGSLFMLKLDADIDVFDAEAIAGAVLAAENATVAALLPDARQSRNTIVIDQLAMFIVYEAVVPIPVPFSFRELGIDCVRPSGLTLQASVSFDPLANGLQQILPTLHDLYDFAKYPDRPEGELPTKGALKLDAKIGPVCFGLPAFLGGKVYGAKDAPLVDVDLYALFANVLNGIKFFDPTNFLRGIPLERRVGQIELNFGPLHFALVCAATTRQEFGEGLKWRDPALAPSGVVALDPTERAALLKLVPDSPQGADGLVLILIGSADVASIFKVDGQFGMITARRSGFASGVHLRAVFLNQLTCDVSGSVAIFMGDDGFPPTGFIGAATLAFGSQTVLHAEAELTNERIAFSGTANLFPDFPAIVLKSDVSASITGAGFSATGKAVVSLFGAVSTSTQFTLTDRKFALTTGLTLPHDSATLSLTVNATTLDPKAFGQMSVTGFFEESFSPLVVAQAAAQAEQKLHDAVNARLEWARNGLAKDLGKWPWEQDHFIPTWEAYIAVYGALSLQLSAYETIGAAARWAIQPALALLPAPIAQGISYLQGGAAGLFDQTLKITLSGRMDACRASGQVTLTVSGAYAGKPFGPFSFTTRLDAAGLASTIATKVVTYVLGV